MDVARNRSWTQNSFEQCCVLKDKFRRERCGSNLAIDRKVQGGMGEYSSGMSWIKH